MSTVGSVASMYMRQMAVAACDERIELLVKAIGEHAKAQLDSKHVRFARDTLREVRNTIDALPDE